MRILRFLFCSSLVVSGISQGPMAAALSLILAAAIFLWLGSIYDGSKHQQRMEVSWYVLIMVSGLFSLAFGAWAFFALLLASPILFILWVFYMSRWERDLTLRLTSATVANGETTSTSPIMITATFSNDVTGFNEYKVDTFNCSVGTFAGSGSTYTFRLVPKDIGKVSIAVHPEEVCDTDGNRNKRAEYNFIYSQVTT